MKAEDTTRVAVYLHIGDGIVKKVWRFLNDDIHNYTRATVQNEIVQLFPDIDRKNLKLQMWYTDELVGKVRHFVWCTVISHINGMGYTSLYQFTNSPSNWQDYWSG